MTPYRIDLTTFDDCLATNNELCRYYFYVRPDGRYRLWQINADLLGDVRTGALRHQILVGVDRYSTRKEGTTYLQQLPSVDIDHPDLGHTPPLDLASAASMDVLDRNSWTSFYVQDQVTLGSVHVVGALRHDRTSAVYAPPGTPPNRQSFTTPRLGVVWEVVENQALYAQYQDSVAANNGRDLVTLKELAAERANQVELGYKLARADGRLSTTVAAYQLTKRNRADYSLYPIIQTVGEARSRGVEWDVAGQATSRLAFLGSYSYTDAVVDTGPAVPGETAGQRAPQLRQPLGSLSARRELGGRWRRLLPGPAPGRPDQLVPVAGLRPVRRHDLAGLPRGGAPGHGAVERREPVRPPLLHRKPSVRPGLDPAGRSRTTLLDLRLDR